MSDHKNVNVFVAWDFSHVPSRKLLENCRSSLTTLADGRELVWTIPGITLGASGTIGRDVVERGVRAADRVIALVDSPNANVGWEAGFAMGMGKHVGFGALKTRPTWVVEGSLAGVYVDERLDGRDAMARLITAPDWEPPKLSDIPRGATADPGERCTFVLCPKGVEGEGLRHAIEQDLGQHVKLSTSNGPKLSELPAALRGCKNAVWAICIHTEDHDRDGVSNASNAVIAGMLRAWGYPLSILKSSSARTVTDVVELCVQFDGLNAFSEALRTAMAIATPEPDIDALVATMPKPIAVPNGIQAAMLQDRLVRLLRSRIQIEKIAERLGINELPNGTSDQLWADIQRQMRNRDADIRLLIAMALAADPDDEFLKRLAGAAPSSSPLK